MSLNWDLTKVRDFESLWEEVDEGPRQGKGQKLKPFAESVIWATIMTDLGEVTAKNVEEWDFRLRALEMIGSTNMIEWSDDKIRRECNPTREHIERMIGLRVNVASVSRDAWLRGMFRRHLEGAVRDAQRRAREAAA